MSGFYSNDAHEPIFEVLLAPLLTGAKNAEEIQWRFDERKKNILTKRLKVVSVDIFCFRAEICIGEIPRFFTLKGKIFAKISQICVLSLEKMTSRIEKDVELNLIPDDVDYSDGLDGPDFEFYSGQKCDIGEIMAVELGLSIDPYPRKIGVSLKEVDPNLTGINLNNAEEYQANRAQKMKSPFLVLNKLKKH
ncbi:MAG: DUF177 domain-containing protein [Pseudomonadota bacterium]|nr:DUF177 domain-containing protein [Pseudomonadota bacterium]